MIFSLLNSASTQIRSIPLWAFSALMAWPAVVYARQPDILLLCFVAALLSYLVWYLRLVRFGRELRTKSR